MNKLEFEAIRKENKTLLANFSSWLSKAGFSKQMIKNHFDRGSFPEWMEAEEECLDEGLEW